MLAECFYTGASITFKAIKWKNIYCCPFQFLTVNIPSQESRWLPTEQGRTRSLDGSPLCNFDHSHFDLILVLVPAWGGGNSSRPCSGSSICWRCNHDQAVGACQAGATTAQWTKSLRIVCFISSSSFRMVERLMSRLTKILEYRWILLSQNVSPAHFTEFKFHSFGVD